MLTIAARTVGGLRDSSTIEEIESDLAKMIEDFDRAVNVEALRRIKETGEHLSLVLDGQSLIVSCRAGAFAWATGTCQDKL